VPRRDRTVVLTCIQESEDVDVVDGESEAGDEEDELPEEDVEVRAPLRASWPVGSL
jgi:hypothetical protein